MPPLSENIKNLRKQKKLTQLELANRLDVAKATISAYENGSRLPSYNVLIKLANVFKVSTDYLLGNEKKEVVDVSGLNRSQRNTVQEIIFAYQQYNMYVDNNSSLF